MQEGGTAKLTIPADIAYGDGRLAAEHPGRRGRSASRSACPGLTGGVGRLEHKMRWLAQKSSNFQTGTSIGDRASVGVRTPRSSSSPTPIAPTSSSSSSAASSARPRYAA